MPIYEYYCQQCGQKTERLQNFNDPPMTVCEECGGDLKKLVSAPAFQFKGSGWYVTDYARKDSGGKSSGSDGDGSGSDGDSSSDGSAAEKSEKSSSGDDKKSSSKGSEEKSA